jgi:hypothetical protein
MAEAAKLSDYPGDAYGWRWRDTGNDREVVFVPQAFNWKVGYCRAGDRTGVEDGWEYETREAAVADFLTWNGEGDPPGPWIRHPASGRRRPGGDASKEYVRP